jgi:hypothetical protein
VMARVSISLLALAWSLVVAGAQPEAGPALAWHGSTEIAKGRGERGPWQQSRSRFDYVDDPAVAIDERGDLAVAWVDQGRKAVLFQRYAADGARQLEQPVDVSRHPETFSWLPRLALAPAAPDKVFVLWQEIIFSGGSHGGDILFARSEDGGRRFSPPVNLSKSLGGDGKGRIDKEHWHNGSLDLVVAPDGTAIYTVWTEYDGPLWFARSGDGGKTFSRPARLDAGAHPVRAPAMALAPDGALYLAWTIGDDEGADIHVTRSTDAGRTFAPPRAVGRSKAYADAPKLAVDGAGTVHLAYAQSAGGPFARYHVRYTRSTDQARSFEPPREISRPLPESFVGAGFPSLEVDAQGRVCVSWELFTAPRQLPRGLGFSVSKDGGGSFSPPVLVPGSVDAQGGFNGSNQGLLMKKLAVNRSGAFVIANSSLKPGSHSRVWVTRGQLAP